MKAAPGEREPPPAPARFCGWSRECLIEEITHLDDLVVRSALREMGHHVRPVMRRLVSKAGFCDLDEDCLNENDSFLQQWFSLRHEHDFHLRKEAFEKVIERECRSVIGKADEWNALLVDMIAAAVSAQQSEVRVPTDLEDWAVRHVYKAVLATLLDGDMELVREVCSSTERTTV